MDAKAITILQTVFGFDEFRPLQGDIVDTVCQGKDALVIMPTGGGKSLCYQIPALVRPGCGIVISPLIALMQDQVDALAEQGVSAAYLNSTLSFDETQAIETALLHGELDMLYIAPERLTQIRTLELLEKVSIALFAIDEAHCVSQWGHDFRSDYLQLSLLAERFADVPRIALTATADARTREEIANRLGLSTAQHFIAGFDRPNIQYRIVQKENTRQQLLQFLRAEHQGDAGIVYCLSRRKVEETANWLQTQGYDALPYHAGMAAEQRAAHQSRFLREDGVIIVATIAFGMGIDKPDVRFVAHLDIPKSVEAYYQETGRAGRDGQDSTAWMAYGLQDTIKLKQMVDDSQANDEFKRSERQKLDAILGLCEISSCRRHALLAYFGENGEEHCGNCDNCIEPPHIWDATDPARKALSCVYRCEQRFGVAHLVDVLTGKQTDKVDQFGHQHVSTFGIGKDIDKNQWRSVFRQLVARGYLHANAELYGALQLTERSRPILRGEESINLRRDAGKAARRSRKSSARAGSGSGALWDALRQCRKALADEHGVPPFVIFHDAVLVQMMEAKPQTEDDLLAINGVGMAKLERYGEAFLEVIKSVESNPQKEGEKHSETRNETLRLLNQNCDVATIAERRGLSESTVYNHVETLIRDARIPLSQALDINETLRRTIVQHLLDHGAAEETGLRLRPVFEAMGEQVSYPLIRCVNADLQLRLSG